MEKRKYDITIADVEMSILSDEREDFVTRLVSELDAKIREITLASKRCSTLDAAILVALESSGEKLKADKRIRTLEAQISLYDANLRRVREENVKLKNAILEGSAALPEEPAAVQEPAAETAEDEPEQISLEEPAEKEKESAAAPTEETAASAPTASAAPARSDKLRQIESLLRGRE